MSINLQRRKLARVVAPVVCAAYVTYVAVDRGYYHYARKAEIEENTRQAKAEAARRVARTERELAKEARARDRETLKGRAAAGAAGHRAGPALPGPPLEAVAHAPLRAARDRGLPQEVDPVRRL